MEPLAPPVLPSVGGGKDELTLSLSREDMPLGPQPELLILWGGERILLPVTSHRVPGEILGISGEGAFDDPIQ